MYQSRLTAELQKPGGSPEDIYDFLKTKLKKGASEILGITSKGKRKQDEELKEIVEEKRAAYLKWLSTKEEEDKIIYRKKKKEVKQRIRQKKNEDWEKTCQKVNVHLGYKRSAEAWEVLKSLSKETKHKANLSMKNVEEWCD